MKEKLQKIAMAVAAIIMFSGVMLLSVEKNDQGQWKFATLSSLAQGGEDGGGEDGGGEDGGGNSDLWTRVDNDCVHTFTGKAGAKIKILGGTVTITIGADGTATYVYGDGSTNCTAGGQDQCTARYCPPLQL